MKLRIEPGTIDLVSNANGMAIETGMARVWVQVGNTLEVNLLHLISAHKAMKAAEGFFLNTGTDAWPAAPPAKETP